MYVLIVYKKNPREKGHIKIALYFTTQRKIYKNILKFNNIYTWNSRVTIRGEPHEKNNLRAQIIFLKAYIFSMSKRKTQHVLFYLILRSLQHVRVSEKFRKLITFKMDYKINSSSICSVVLLYFLGERNNYFSVI